MNIEQKDIIATGKVPNVKFTDESEQIIKNNHPPVTRMKFRLICASKCKKFAIEVAKTNPVQQRAKKFTRVSEDFLIACEVNLKNFIINRVQTHPSKGKTLT